MELECPTGSTRSLSREFSRLVVLYLRRELVSGRAALLYICRRTAASRSDRLGIDLELTPRLQTQFKYEGSASVSLRRIPRCSSAVRDASDWCGRLCILRRLYREQRVHGVFGLDTGISSKALTRSECLWADPAWRGVLSAARRSPRSWSSHDARVAGCSMIERSFGCRVVYCGAHRGHRSHGFSRLCSRPVLATISPHTPRRKAPASRVKPSKRCHHPPIIRVCR